MSKEIACFWQEVMSTDRAATAIIEKPGERFAEDTGHQRTFLTGEMGKKPAIRESNSQTLRRLLLRI